MASRITKMPVMELHAVKAEAGVQGVITIAGQDVHEPASRAANLHRVKR